MKPTFSQLSKLIHFEKHSLYLSEDEVTDQLLHKSGGAYFLGHYSLEDIRESLQRISIMEDIRAQEFYNVVVSLDTGDPYHHRITFHYDCEDQEHLLGEIRIGEGVFRPKTHFVPEIKLEGLNMIIIEWFCLQNPRKKFSPERPRLPGQKYPGLGVARKAIALLTDLARGLHKDGILNFPEYYHNAAIYSEIFQFYNPMMQGMLLAMKRDLGVHPLDKVSQAILDGKLWEKNSRKKQDWLSEEQVLPISQRTLNYFSSETYLRLCTEASRIHSYEIVWSA